MMHNAATLVDPSSFQVTDTPAQSAEPLQVKPVIRKLFMLFHGSYGSLFLSKFSTGEKDAQGRDKGIRAAMKVWESKLAHYPQEVIETAAGRAVDLHAEYPPNLPQFETLCVAAMPRKTYAEEAGWPRLAAPSPAPPMEVSFEMRGDGKDWARRILARDEAGEKIRPYTLTSARQALGLEGRMPWH